MAVCNPRNETHKDLVWTPPELAKQIIGHYSPSGLILDPARGPGAFYNNFPKACTKDWCELSEGKDFFEYDERVDWIITNPPWSILRAFLQHSMDIKADNIVLLMTINALTTRARFRSIVKSGYGIKELYCVDAPAKPWPVSGFELAAIHIKRGYEGPIHTTWGLRQ